MAIRSALETTIFPLTETLEKAVLLAFVGAVAQLEERYNGIVEVVGSIPIGSTNLARGPSNRRR